MVFLSGELLELGKTLPRKAVGPITCLYYLTDEMRIFSTERGKNLWKGKLFGAEFTRRGNYNFRDLNYVCAFERCPSKASAADRKPGSPRG